MITLLGAIALIVGLHQSRVIRSNLDKRGLAVANSLAATSKAALATYNYIALEQTVNQALQDPDSVYVIIHDKEGRVAGYSGRPDLQGKLLEDQFTVHAISESRQPLIQRGIWGDNNIPVVDVSVPVFLPGSDYRWGTVRVALSLQPMYQQIRQIQLIIGLIGLVALAVGVLLSFWAARRITRPLGVLMEATVQAAQGNLDQKVEIKTRDEVEVLANNFSMMIREIIAQRDQLEVQLKHIKRLQRYTEQLLTTMNDGLLSVDRTGKVATINPAASEMLGFSQRLEQDLSIRELLAATPELLRYIDEILQQPQGRSQQEIRIDGGHNPQVILAGSSQLTDTDGNLLEVIVNLHDITELKKLESRLRQTERLAALGTLAAGMAHEIRNPLSAIKTFVQLLPRKLEKPGFLEKFQRTVPRELDRINRLIEDLLQLAKEPKYHFESVDVGFLIEQCLDLFGESLKDSQIHCRTARMADKPFWVWADKDQLIKAFYNLFQNAVQAMPNGGDLTIEVNRLGVVPFDSRASSERRDWILSRFKDTGMGISDDNIKNIFNPFFTTKDTGTGLGLAITHKVITEHGGHVEVSSRVGEGSCFTVYLPASKES
ncbi:MAG: ATP-binding protein [Desulforhabdus sp.]|nr:ATP-binding protein [Desulforhabdus sp.]